LLDEATNARHLGYAFGLGEAVPMRSKSSALQPPPLPSRSAQSQLSAKGGQSCCLPILSSENEKESHMKIDWWTLGLQTLNALVLIWLLSRFLFQPVANIFAARQKAAEQVLSDAQAARTAAEGERAKAAAETARLAEHRNESAASARPLGGKTRTRAGPSKRVRAPRR
jgi:hypothetical protein